MDVKVDPVKARAGRLGGLASAAKRRLENDAPMTVSLRGLSEENRRIIARFVARVRSGQQ